MSCHCSSRQSPSSFPVALSGSHEVSTQPSFSRLNSLNFFSPSLQGRCSSPLTSIGTYGLAPAVLCPSWAGCLRAVLSTAGGVSQEQSRGDSALPRPAAHVPWDAGQDSVGFLHSECSVPVRGEIFINHYPQVFLCRAALNHFSA